MLRTAQQGNSVKDVPKHMEAALGPIAKGWSDPGSKLGVQVVSFESSPTTGITTLATLGLNRYLLEQTSGTRVRQELLTSVETGAQLDAIAKALLSIAENLIARGVGLARGQLVTPRSEISDQPLISTFYCTNPSPLDPRLTHTEEFEPPLVFVYLVALLEGEARLVQEHGWRWFEEQLEAQDPNIWDLSRTLGVVSR